VLAGNVLRDGIPDLKIHWNLGLASISVDSSSQRNTVVNNV